MTTKALRQTVVLPASPHDVYEAWMDAKKHAAFIGGGVTMNRQVGGAFTVFDEWASGKNIELVPDKKIVQDWRASDWPEDAMSRIVVTLEEVGGPPSRGLQRARKTKLNFVQIGIPAEFYDDIKQGWTDYYWKPMKEYFGSRS